MNAKSDSTDSLRSRPSRPLRLGSVVLCAAVLVLALILAPTAGAATSETICHFGSAAGQCYLPSGVAVDQSGGPGGIGGTVYLVDNNNRRIDVFDAAGRFLMAFGTGVVDGASELQTCVTVCGANPFFFSGLQPTGIAVNQTNHDVYVSEKGSVQKYAFDPLTEKFEFLLSYGGGVLDGGATGTGDLTAGSAEIANVNTTSRRFTAGQTITGSGIPSGTRIVEVKYFYFGPEKLILSHSATATAKAVALTVPTPPANNPVNEVQAVTLTGAPTGGIFGLLGGVEGSFTATTSTGSPSVTAVSAVVAEGRLEAGSNKVATTGAQAGALRVGQTVAEQGIPSGTTIVETVPDLVLSANATQTIRAGLSVTAHGTGNLATGSNVVSSVANVGEFVAGQTIVGAGIPAGTKIATVNEAESELVLSASATASGSAVALTATDRPTVPVGEGVTGPGIPAGATIASVASNGDITLSANATASASTDLRSGVPFNASAATLRSLLESSYGAGNVEVTGAAGGPWEVEFKGADADTNVSQMNANGSGLTPSGGVEVKTLVEGASGFETCTKEEVAEGYLCLNGLPGSGPGQMGGGRLPMAVDAATHHVWVAGVDRIEQFGEAGEYLSEVSVPGSGEITGLASDPTGNIYTLTPSSGESDERDKLTDPQETPYTLTFGGYTTPSLAGSASPVEIQQALEGLPSIGRGNVRARYEFVNNPSCSGKSTAEACDITFTGKLAVTNVGPVTASGGATVTTTHDGQPGTPGVLSKLKQNGELIEQIDAGGHPVALGVDSGSGDLYVSDQPGGSENPGIATILRFSSTGKELESFGGGEVIGAPCGNSVAFSDTEQRVYLASCEGSEESAGEWIAPPPPGPLVERGSVTASAVRKTTATVYGYVNPEGKATTYRFQYITEAQFDKNEEEGHEGFAGAEQSALSASIGEDFSFHKAQVALTGLLPATGYRFRIVAYNSNAPVGVVGETVSFTTLAPASVDASVAEVTASSAKLIAQINPLGDATSYRFQYISREAALLNEEAGRLPFTGASVAPASEVPIGSGEEPVSVTQYVQGLSAHTVYYYRVDAVNVAAPGGFGSATLTFTTQAQAATGAAVLPDGREWELASPPNKHGALLLPIAQEGVVQAAASGDAIAYLANSPVETEPQGSEGAGQVLSARGTSGWSSKDLAAVHSSAPGATIGLGHEYRFFSSDLSLGALQPFGAFEPSLSPEASEQTPYVRSNFGSRSTGFCAESCYRPLLTSEDVTSGAQFGTCPKTETLCGAQFVGASPDLSHVLLESAVGLTATPGDKGGLYEYSEGHLALVSVLPNGAPTKGALGFQDRIARGAVSSDGSRVVWSTNGPFHLYLRDNAMRGQSAVNGAGECTEPEAACTVQLDAVQGGSGSGSASPEFQLASEDGSRVFFMGKQQLTSNSGASESGPDLYECAIEKEASGRLLCALTDLTPIVKGESSDLLGTIPGASTDGSYVYFVADGSLAGAQVNGRGETARTGSPNLYVRHAGVTSFIAGLSANDSPDWAGPDGNLGGLTSRVSPDGRWLAFMSQSSLTGYDNRDAGSGRPDEEVFLYHAPASGSEAKLICASCNPTGARPHGVEYGSASKAKMPLAGGSRVWQDEAWLAANVPGWTPYKSTDALYQSRYLSNGGRLFFNSADALVPQDTNGTVDVYQYEPPAGEGSPPHDSCSASDPSYVPLASGCVSLMSSGESPEESAFLDASETGSDVFFLTGSHLSTLDTDGALDVYDAHVCTSESPCPPPPPPPPPSCQGDACQSPAVAPEALTPSSFTFSGAGNAAPVAPAAVAPKTKQRTRAEKLATALRACSKKKSKRKRNLCEKRARRAYASPARAGKSRKGGRK